MNWSALVTDTADQLWEDHGLAQAHAETHTAPNRHTVMWRDGHRTGFKAALLYAYNTLLMWDSLTEGEAITELRKGTGSLFYPLFKDDPRVWVDCPRDGRVTVSKEGTCDRCLFDFSEA